MALSDFANITVTGDAPAITQVGFGTLLCAAYLAAGDLVRTYTALSQLTTDSIASTDSAYRMVQRAFQQSPRPERVKLGRLTSPATMTKRITPVAVHSATYAITIDVPGETVTEVSIAADTATTVDEICDALEAAIVALQGAGEPFENLTVTPVGGATATALDLSMAAGSYFYLSGWRNDRLRVEDLTAAPGTLAAELDAIRAFDADFYGLATDVNSQPFAETVADWAETQDLVYATNTSDYNALDSGSTADIQSQLAAKSYIRSICGFDLDDDGGYMGVAMLAERFPSDPGVGPAAGGTFNAKTLAGVTADALTPTQQTNLRTKGYTVYITTAGVNHTLGGETPSGEYLDHTRFVDWYRIRLQEDLATLILNNERVPYDGRGLSMVEGVLRARLAAGIRSGGIAPVDADGNEPSVEVPALSETSSADRGNRVLNGCKTMFMYAGAIHKVGVVITVTS
jgi:hypothetical protein